MTTDERQRLEERAAIMEYDGGMDRPEAERLARKCLDGTFEEPLQQPLNLGQQQFRQQMKQIWRHY